MRKRDDLFDVDPPEEGKTSEESEEEFFFEMSDDEPLEAESSDEPIADEPDMKDSTVDQDVEPVAAKGGSRQRILLLLLLVIVLLGAGYFLVGDIFFAPEPAPAPQVVKNQPQKLKVPERKVVQQEQKAVKEVVMPSEKVAAVPIEKKPVILEKPSVDEKTQAEKTADVDSAANTAQKQVAKSVAVPVEAVAKEEPVVAQTFKTPAMTTEKVEGEVTSLVPTANAPYVLQIGSYILDSNMKRALEAVKSLGYEPSIVEGQKSVSMIRLRVGAYPEKIARGKLSEMQQLLPSAFLLHEGDQMALYAGSFYSLDHARVQADRIFQHEIIVYEEAVDVSVPIKSLRFGNFSDIAAAEAVAIKAKELGLESLIVKQN